MNLNELLNHALNKENFITIEDYLDFSKYYLEFIKKNLQAVIVSKNENHYQFFQYKEDGTYNVTRPINSNLLYSLEEFETSSIKFIELVSNIREQEFDTSNNRLLINRLIYSSQQSIGACLDALPAINSNTARKINGDLFERFIRLIIERCGLEVTEGTIRVPVEVDGHKAFMMNYQHDLNLIKNGEVMAIGSVKTSSKDRLDKVFIDKFLYNRLTEKNTPHFAIFLNDVQRKGQEGKYGISATFLPGHFKGYTVKLNPLDGVYYCDIRPNMLSEAILKDHIKTFDHFLFSDMWDFVK
ncbi:TPA: hypothetical protein ACMDPN_002667 [Vibrio cholerae]|uniref:hypothetical protein n=1 Tax=Vibrio cholerae TaxID=666 RepID=UPI0001542398|nr:hypothetical protein [Vibrio cholerae]EGQ9322088.1 hypothetical protein [Vibrio cholerae]EGQ9460732.1 hypothetical protein [Vibrio cholerae]EGQ9647663.1 hypothetical protein [Vibrio cholerae]EJL6640932.1 hypothetical protein [Vibrio cholerae]KNH55068.1 hypothetical protein A59_1545 [Vibrio cholerae 623-39]